MGESQCKLFFMALQIYVVIPVGSKERERKRKEKLTKSALGNDWFGGITRLSRTSFVHSPYSELVLSSFFETFNSSGRDVTINDLSFLPFFVEFTLEVCGGKSALHFVNLFIDKLRYHLAKKKKKKSSKISRLSLILTI